jgi:phosphatidylglycerophosphatase A
MTRLAVWIATAGGAGYSPIAPGTAGSAVGIVVWALTAGWSVPSQALLAALVTAFGVWASSLAAAHFERPDPSPVVIDEVAGQLITLLGTGVGFTGAIAGFFIFRALDIIKPWPAGRLERWHGGLGIMADDVMAAVYANVLLQVLVRLLPGVF